VSASRRYVGALADDRRFRELVVSRPWPLRGREAELALIRELLFAAQRGDGSFPVVKVRAGFGTVAGHLHQTFPKLGTATRAALRDALNAVTTEQQRAGGDG
jgi:hypothetical protein